MNKNIDWGPFASEDSLYHAAFSVRLKKAADFQQKLAKGSIDREGKEFENGCMLLKSIAIEIIEAWL